MWHEARRQEKMVRAKMVDNAKRNERRKQFYESVRKEPEGFMQLHGQRMHIHVDPTEAAAADSHNSMRKWQGDPNILIDRFDVRVYLDSIPETVANSTAKKNVPKDDVIELQCDYERYRILVFNEFRKVNEKQFLNEIAAKEFWPAQQQTNQSMNAAYKREIEKKRKSASKRAAIAFNYADSTEAAAATGASHTAREQHHRSSSSSSDEEDFDEVEEIDNVLDTTVLTAEQAATLNKIGAHFNITSGAFLQLLSLDRKEQTSTAQIREIDKAKLALSGRHAKADRALLKRKRALIIGNLGSNAQSSEEATTTLLSFLAASSKNELNEESSSSESGEEFVRTEFITSFGGDEERDDANGGNAGEVVARGPIDDEGVEKEAVVQGPILPNREYRRLLELSRRRSNSPENAWERKDHRAEEKGRSGDARHGHRRSSRSPSRRNHRRTTRSRERERRRHNSRSRSRNSGRQRRRHRSSSLSPSSPSPKRSVTASTSRKTVRQGEEQRGRSAERERKDKGTRMRRCSSSSSSRSHSHKIGNGDAKLGQQSPHFVTGRKSPTSSDDSDSPLSVHSSMSESEKERIERENRKRRIRKTKRSVKAQQQQTNTEIGQEEAEKKAERAAKKLRQQMQKALTKTAAQLKEEEEQRQREMIREKKRREELLLEESRLLRRREREKRKTDDGRERERRESEAHATAGRRRRRSSSDN